MNVALSIIGCAWLAALLWARWLDHRWKREQEQEGSQ